MGLGTWQQDKQPFTEGEKRLLTIRAERIDPKYLVSDPMVSPEPTVPPPVEAEHKRTERHPTHESRYYELVAGSREPVAGEKQKPTTPDVHRDGLPATVRIQLNHGDPAADESRLAEITEDLLGSQEPVAGSQEKPTTDYGLPATDEGGEE